MCRFDILANGGASLTLSFERAPFLTQFRTVWIPWNVFYVMDTLVMKKEENDIPSCDLSGFIRPSPLIVATPLSTFFRSSPENGPIIPETQVRLSLNQAACEISYLQATMWLMQIWKLKQSFPQNVLIRDCKWNVVFSWSAGAWILIYSHVQKRVSYGSSQHECAMSLDMLCVPFSWSQKKEPLRTVMALNKKTWGNSLFSALILHPAWSTQRKNSFES